MPTIELQLEDLERLTGKALPRGRDQLDEILSQIKGEIEDLVANPNGSGTDLKLEIKDSNRPDLWSAEGIARALQGFLDIESGLKPYRVEHRSNVVVEVALGLKQIRPYIACSVVQGVSLSDESIRGLMRLQEKLDQTYGRRRKKSSIGFYNFDMIKPPLHYMTAKPDQVAFAPLGFEREMTLGQITKEHPKGVEYSPILGQHTEWPVLADSAKKILSFPPIINSNDLGRITEQTKNVLIEVTGTSHDAVLSTLTIMTTAMADRGGRTLSCLVKYPYGDFGVVETPELRTRKVPLEPDYVRRMLGLGISIHDIKKLLQKARFEAEEARENRITVEVPCYRKDVMHAIDIVEDIAIAYGYNRIQPRWPQMLTIGELSREERLASVEKEIMLGLGYQEVLTYILTNPENLFTRMNLSPSQVVELTNPKMLTYTAVRNWLLPSLMEFLGNNTHAEYPQRIFEIGICVIPEPKAETLAEDHKKLGAVYADSSSNFAGMKSDLDALLLNIGLEYDLEEIDLPYFIEGRAGKISCQNRKIGFIGEIHPGILENWKIENPVAGLELDLNVLFAVLGDKAT